MAKWIDIMLEGTGMYLREAVAAYASQLSWAQCEAKRANQKIKRVEDLMEKFRQEKRFDVSDAIREAING